MMPSSSYTPELIGKRFGKRIIIGPAPSSVQGAIRVMCRCDCGSLSAILLTQLRSGRSRSCIQCTGRFLRNEGLADRLWSRVQKGDGCWLWTAGTTRKGYGHFKANNKTCITHRVAWEVTYGPIPDGMCVCHRCDTPRCCRPDHLFLGDNTVNVLDSVHKGRRSKGKQRPAPKRSDVGSLHFRATLTEEIVSLARRRYAQKDVTMVALAAELGFKYDTLRAAIRGITWRHLPFP